MYPKDVVKEIANCLELYPSLLGLHYFPRPVCWNKNITIVLLYVLICFRFYTGRLGESLFLSGGAT